MLFKISRSKENFHQWHSILYVPSSLAWICFLTSKTSFKCLPNLPLIHHYKAKIDISSHHMCLIFFSCACDKNYFWWNQISQLNKADTEKLYLYPQRHIHKMSIFHQFKILSRLSPLKIIAGRHNSIFQVNFRSSIIIFNFMILNIFFLFVLI